MSKFFYTTALDKIRRMTARKKVIQGGTSAGKTFSILPILIDKAIRTPFLDITVIGHSVPHLKGGAMKDFLKIMQMTNRYKSNRFNISDRRYTFKNGSTIEFVNADGDKAIGPRRNIMYINEANLIDYTTYTQLAIRTDGEIFIDFNPTKNFWVHTDVLTESDSELLVINYIDNEALAQNTIDDLLEKKNKGYNSDGTVKNKYWANWWKVYGLGEVGRLEGLVFENWEMIDDVPEGAEIIATGLDWGYVNDVTAIVNVWRYNGKIILDEKCYKTGLQNHQISSRLTEYGINWEVIADSSEQKSVDALKFDGHWMTGAKKPPGSVIQGISIMQGYDIQITRQSTNVIKEFESYSWKMDGNNNSTNNPTDKDNHAIDAIRYVFYMKLDREDTTMRFF